MASRALLAVFFLLHGSGALHAEEIPFPDSEVRAAIRDLASPDYEIREATTQRLLAWGRAEPEKVLRLLGEAAGEDEEPEFLHRLRSLRAELDIERICRGISWGTRPPKALAAFRDFLRTPSFQTLHIFAHACPSPPEETVEHLLPFLATGSDPDLRCYVAVCLGRWRLSSAVQNLVAALDDPDKKVRFAAAEALGRMGDPSLAEHLLKPLFDADVDVRAAAACALRDLANRDILPRIYDLLKRSHPGSIRSGALLAIQFYNDKEKSLVRQILGMASDTTDGEIRAALFVLRYLEFEKWDGRGNLMPWILIALDHPHDDFRGNALHVLKELGNSDPDPETLSRLAAIIAEDDNYKIRIAAIDAMQVLGAFDPETPSRLAAVLTRDPDPLVRREAAIALLAMLGEKPVRTTNETSRATGKKRPIHFWGDDPVARAEACWQASPANPKNRERTRGH